jgi:c(7)-type cytochrome triheme protein
MRKGMVKVLIAAGAIWGLCAPSPSQENFDFSHPLHLQAGARCPDCHASAVSSAVSGDRNLPAQKACRACHNEPQAFALEALDRLPTPPRPARFSHKQHVALSKIASTLAYAIDNGEYLGAGKDIRPLLNTEDACAACHRGLDRDEHAGAAHLPRMADCLVCHDRIDPPASCAKCHTEPAAKLKPATHAPGFLEQHADSASGLEKSACKGCHGTRFQCQGCH